MPRLRLETLVVPLAAALLVSCGDATAPAGPSGPPLPLPLILGLKETFLSPRDIQRVAVTVYPDQGDSIVSAYFLLGGSLVVDSIPLPMAGDQPQVGYVDFTVPIAPLTGTVYVTAVVNTQARHGTADTLFSVGDDGVPQVSAGPVPDSVAAGATIPILCTGFDRSGIQSARAEAHGIVDTLFTSADGSFPQSYYLYGGAAVPLSASAGTLVTVSCTMTDIYGHAVSTLDTVVVATGP